MMCAMSMLQKLGLGMAPSISEIEAYRARAFALNVPVLYVPEAIRVLQSDEPYITMEMKFIMLLEIWKKAVEIEQYRIWSGLITPDVSKQCELFNVLEQRNTWVKASMDKESFKAQIAELVKDGDVDRIVDIFAGMYRSLESQYRKKLEIYANKQTDPKNYRLPPSKDMKMLRVDLFYVRTRIPRYCPYCETFLAEKWADITGYNWLRNQMSDGKGILEELHLDKLQYNLVEWPSDWNDGICSGKDHPDYSHVLTKEGINYLTAKGVLVNPFFPSMMVTLLQESKPYRSFIFRALGEKRRVTNPETGKKEDKLKFKIRELIFAFLEGNDMQMRSIIARTPTRDPNRAIVNDPRLYRY